MRPLGHGGVLCLDLGGTVGWAYGPLEAVSPAFDHFVLPRIGGEGMRYVACENELAALVKTLSPSALVLERPLPLPAQTHMRTAEQQLTLRGIAYMQGYRSRIPVSEIDADTARLEVIGQSRFGKGAVKAEVVAHCRKRGIDVSNHNAADACILWLWHKMRVTGRAPLAGPLWRSAVERGALLS